MSTVLRDISPADAAWLDSWLGACASAVGYVAIEPGAPFASLQRCLGDGLTARVIVAGQDVGIATYRIAGAQGTIEFIGVQTQHARRGFGHRAATLVEDAMRNVGVARNFAPAPEHHGIALYFWIRLGYRPLLRSEWPCARDGVAWLARDLDQS
jgi:hypothetical protein